MSIPRVKSRQINHSVFLQNRLSKFTAPPMLTGDCIVEKNEFIGGNLNVNGNLTVDKNLMVNGDLSARNFYASGNYYLDNYVLIPPGTIIQSAATNEPAGWLNCDGRELNRDQYYDLFTAIGLTYTIPSENDTSFNIPDCRGRVNIGSGTGSGLSTRLLGATGGEENHTLTIQEMPSHSHELDRRLNPENTACDPNDAHANNPSACTTDRETNIIFNTYPKGNGAEHNNMQPFIVLRNLIKY
jgi:microcystin-dependent protein